MNCPHHIVVYHSGPAQLPRPSAANRGDRQELAAREVRAALIGMNRVRSFTLNDAHIFCTPDQVMGEVQGRDRAGATTSERARGSTTFRTGSRHATTSKRSGRAPRSNGSAPRRRSIEALEIDGPEVQDRRWGCSVLRAEDRLPGQGRSPARIHQLHRAGRLPVAREIRPRVRGRGWLATATGHGASRRRSARWSECSAT